VSPLAPISNPRPLGSSNSRSAATSGHVESWCAVCELREVWRYRFPIADATIVRPTLGPSSFTCEHWRDHHDASDVAVASKSGSGRVGPVTAKRVG